MLARLERRLGEGKVAVGGRGDDDDVDVGVGEQRLDMGIVLGLGVVLGRRVALLRGPLDDAVEPELGRGGDEGDVEDLGRQSGAEQSAESGRLNTIGATYP